MNEEELHKLDRKAFRLELGLDKPQLSPFSIWLDRKTFRTRSYLWFLDRFLDKEFSK